MMMSVNFFSVIGMDYLWNYFIHAHTHTHTEFVSDVSLAVKRYGHNNSYKERESI